MGFKIADSYKGTHYAIVVRAWCKKNGFPVPVKEHYFAKPRMFRFDLAFLEEKIAVEFQGGNWVEGRHTRGEGFERDCEKFSIAAVKGWRVILCTYDQADSGKLFEWLELIFDSTKGSHDTSSTVGE